LSQKGLNSDEICNLRFYFDERIFVLVHGRIPNFRNNPDCSTNLAQLEEFQRARVIEICPSLAQEHLRLFSLAEGK